jgi:GNAT superfamily N-acetyltransferase
MDSAAVLAAFNSQVRQSTRPDGTPARIERDGAIVRRVAPRGQYGSGILWSDLDAGTAGPVIDAQVAYFSDLGEKFEWKLYSYDQPADLASRLLAAGFVPEEAEALMLAEVSQVPRQVALPAGIRLEKVTDAAGIDGLFDVHDQVFGAGEPELRTSLEAQLRAEAQLSAEAQNMVMVVAMAGDEPVCAGRIDFVPGSDFAGLWGGGTLPQWRGRGIYRALVGYRAALAAERGCRYLEVDASPESRPILERIGFSCLAITTPYIWSPG